MNYQLGIDSAYLTGRKNQVTEKTLRMIKDNLMFTNSLLQACPFMNSYRHYHPQLELSLWIFNFLAAASEKLLGPLRLQRHFSPA